jgi:hypothetical protein
MNNKQYKPLTCDHIWFLDNDHCLSGTAAQEFLKQQMSFILYAFNDAYSLKQRICSDLESYIQTDNIITDTDELLELLSRISIYCSMFLSSYEQMMVFINELTDNHIHDQF